MRGCVCSPSSLFLTLHPRWGESLGQTVRCQTVQCQYVISLLPVHRSGKVVHPGVSFHWSTSGLSPHPTAGGRPVRPLSILCPFLRPHPHGCEHNWSFPAYIKSNLCMTLMMCFMFVVMYVDCHVVMIVARWLSCLVPRCNPQLHLITYIFMKTRGDVS